MDLAGLTVRVWVEVRLTNSNTRDASQRPCHPCNFLARLCIDISNFYDYFSLPEYRYTCLCVLEAKKL